MKIGILFLAGEWLGEIGANRGFYSMLPEILKKDALRVKTLLSKYTEIIDVGIVNNKEKAIRAYEIFRRDRVNAIIICYLAWGEDSLLLDVIERLPDVPLLLWAYVPCSKLPASFNMVQLFRFSGPVATMQVSGPLKRMGKRFRVISGSLDNKEIYEEIKRYLKAVRIISELRNLTVGLLPSFCDAMTGTHIEGDILKRYLGMTLQTITVKEYFDISKEISDSEIEKWVQLLKKRYIVEVSNPALYKGVRASLGLLKIIERYNLKALAFNDLDRELHQSFGLRPCITLPGMFEKAVISMEGDVGGAIAMYILRALTEKPVMYTEIFTYEEKTNGFLAGHAGLHNVKLAHNYKKIRIVPDYEYMEVEKDTAAMQFQAKQGPVTMLNIFFNGRDFQMAAVKGKAVDTGKRFDISTYIYIKPEVPVNEFMKKVIRAGTTQHWVVVHQDVLDELVCFTDMGMNIEVSIVK
ncbi:MAG: hypothetical protein NC824_03355 [Candidatus Omnitrophica bacterium]|nr:hypothetical protein [Candidatus Omnitrophota bacterium]